MESKRLNNIKAIIQRLNSSNNPQSCVDYPEMEYTSRRFGTIIIPSGMSWCTKCQRTKPVSAFRNSKNNKKPRLGISAHCKMCSSSYDRTYLADADHAIKARQRARLHNLKRQDILDGLQHHYTVDEWNSLLELSDYRCGKCGNRWELSIDHIIPLTKSGKDTIDNIQVLCLTCNIRKGNKTADYRKYVYNDEQIIMNLTPL